MKIAVIGSGISGLSCAYQLSLAGHEVSLFEANNYFGGHTHTVDVSMGGVTHGVDTGFLVFNHRTYPNLVRLLDLLGVDTTATDMSFSVKMPLSASRILEWAGTSLATVFAQRANLVRPAFLGMLRDILRFHRHTGELMRTGRLESQAGALGDFLRAHRYGDAFRDWYLLPMAGCIWSCPTQTMLSFPLASFVRFCHNHGLLQVNDRPQWYTVTGGARRYVEKLLPFIAHKYLRTPVVSIRRDPGEEGRGESVWVDTLQGRQRFDQVVLATHSDQSLRLLRDADRAECDILGAVRYQPNRAVLHADASCLPRDKQIWSAWNYEGARSNDDMHGSASRVCVHYLINKLQPLPFREPVIVSLNPVSEPDPAKTFASFDYAHPVFDAAAVAAQARLGEVQGRRNTWFAGAWTGYGFHEDGLRSGMAVASAIMKMPQETGARLPA
ncbi:NAD(P)/FAD-dependent oxidoreductase [Noviherbaspirillum galbum]|uniref:FAD-dependent oxidoreductase n=1 Tax=Noviherbaspirillum galbum TaxID=2709383 RepID=A0A6B3STJ1_9BURK|nr:FAD-dependent oxidoreductase [Noviherbaspirillum galbum]NEX64300.1 FAD-dependent oxidoreductase [Noviherbaspirillum galbum]